MRNVDSRLQLAAAEETAKKERRNLWRDYVETTAEDVEAQKAAEPKERKQNLRRIAVTEIYEDQLHFAAQNFSDGEARARANSALIIPPLTGDAIEKLMGNLQREVTETSSYTPRRNEVCACMHSEASLRRDNKVALI